MRGPGRSGAGTAAVCRSTFPGTTATSGTGRGVDKGRQQGSRPRCSGRRRPTRWGKTQAGRFGPIPRPGGRAREHRGTRQKKADTDAKGDLLGPASRAGAVRAPARAKTPAAADPLGARGAARQPQEALRALATFCAYDPRDHTVAAAPELTLVEVLGSSQGCARCALLAAGGVVLCAGKNSGGQLGAGDEAPRSELAAACLPPAFSVAVRRGGTAVCSWGLQRRGQLGRSNTPTAVPGLPQGPHRAAGGRRLFHHRGYAERQSLRRRRALVLLAARDDWVDPWLAAGGGAGEARGCMLRRPGPCGPLRRAHSRSAALGLPPERQLREHRLITGVPSARCWLLLLASGRLSLFPGGEMPIVTLVPFLVDGLLFTKWLAAHTTPSRHEA
eukprot:TRINITY_DN30138_c0_g1_i3.p1 TRINITY_DN30138_c0_g1~~TRINITY_DN30138_c0_g1_i3.p1  ORF type:complete len:388 (+),score=11.68 TRINITY_DN30138_c0_g1_i3:91-1254(+)